MFYSLTFKDLKQLFRSETSRMEEAVTAKDFRTAADLEARLSLFLLLVHLSGQTVPYTLP